MAQTSLKLTRWIINLGGDLRYLQYRAPHMEAEALQKEISRYRNTLRIIYEEARKEQLDLLPYHQALTEIEATLKIIHCEPSLPETC